MELRWTRNDLINTVLRDECGRPVYRIETPNRFRNRKALISRIQPNPAASNTSDSNETAKYVSTDDASDTDIILQRLEEVPVANITWNPHSVQPVFHYNGRERQLNDYLPGQGVMRR